MIRFAKNRAPILVFFFDGNKNGRRQFGRFLLIFAVITAVTLLTACAATPLPSPTTMHSSTPSPVHLITPTALLQPAITVLDTAVPPTNALPTFTPEQFSTPTPEHLNTVTPEHTNTITPNHPTTIPADDPRLSYIGRFNFTNPAAPTFDWPGTAVALSFTGDSLTVLLADSGNWYDVTINGETFVLQTLRNQERYVLATGLGEGVHTARLFKRTESIVGQSTLHGFVLAPGGTIENPPPRPERRIEFVGDSITAGYGVEGDSPTCPFSVATENVTRTYAALATEAVGAEMMITAVSGLGVIRNYNDPEMIGTDPMTVRYGRALANEPHPQWDFQRWRANLVVINLGANDFSTNPQPTQAVFVQAYIDLLNDIRRRYPFAPIIAMAGPILPDYAAGYVETAVTHLNTAQQDHRIHYLRVPNNLVMPDDYGCDYHPNVSGQQKMAAALLPKIREVLGW